MVSPKRNHPKAILRIIFRLEKYDSTISWISAFCGVTPDKKATCLIARIFNIVGPCQTGRYGMVIPWFIKYLLANEPITLYGNGTQTRTFTHWKDAVQLLLKLIDNHEAIGEVVNIGGIEEVTIQSLAERVRGKVGISPEIIMLPYDKVFPHDFEDMLRRVPCLLKPKKLTGYTPLMSLDNILKNAIAHNRN